MHIFTYETYKTWCKVKSALQLFLNTDIDFFHKNFQGKSIATNVN